MTNNRIEVFEQMLEADPSNTMVMFGLAKEYEKLGDHQQVIRVLEGPLALIPCVSKTAYRRCDECLDEETCGVRLAMKEVRDATAHILDNTTLAGLNARTRTSLSRRSR